MIFTSDLVFFFWVFMGMDGCEGGVGVKSILVGRLGETGLVGEYKIPGMIIFPP